MFIRRSVGAAAAVLLVYLTAIVLGQDAGREVISPSDRLAGVDAAAAARTDGDDDAVGGSSDLIANVTIFVLAVFIGFELITKVPPTLHTPLMSGSNAISGITIVGALVIAGSGMWGLEPWTGFVAAILAMINVVGGFLVTHRMLMMFKRK